MKILRAVALLLVAGVVLMPATLWAQGATGNIAGTVRDSSGGVLPGVTVEASSPALIEKVRSVVTDANGEFRIVDLRPGPYTVTFTLPGFAVVRREGIGLTSSFTATVNADMRVGGLEETITVTGESPVVDLSSARQQTTVSRDTLDAIPTTKRLGQYASIIPGAVNQNTSQQDVGGTAGEGGTFAIHGGRVGDQSTNIDGNPVNMLNNDVVSVNSQMVQEVVVETSATSAEAATGGVQINVIPREGGNQFSGTVAGSWTGPDLVTDNLTDDLVKRGLNSAAQIKNFMDVGGGLGGPIKRDKLWFFAAHRMWKSAKYISGAFYNLNQGATPRYVDSDPLYNVSLYEPDLSRPAHTGWAYYNSDVRVTFQATQRNKVVVSMSRNSICNCPIQLSGTGGSNAVKRAPEAAIQHMFVPMYLPAVTWSSPVNDRFLLEAGQSALIQNSHSVQMDGVRTGDIQITDVGLNTIYGSAQGTRRSYQANRNSRFSLSYVTGSHAAKVGMTYQRVDINRPGLYPDPVNSIMGGRTYTFRNGVPQSLTIYNQPFNVVERTNSFALFAQDQWKLSRVTVNLGVRYGTFTGAIPAITLPAGLFVPERTYPAVDDAPNYKSLNPRTSVAYDLFGNGKTAVKASFGRYTPLGYSALNNPASNASSNTTRTWTDSNGNYVPDCDLRNPQVNGECGIWGDLSFGGVRPGTSWAENAIKGFNVQQYNWQGSVSLQHELRPGVALNVGYFRTSYGNFLITDNEAVTAADYDEYCITRPSAPSQGGVTMPGAGERLCGFFDLNPSAATRAPQQVRKLASDVGKRTEVYNGVDITVNARFGQGGLLAGGMSVGRTTTDACDIAAKAPETTFSTDGTTAGLGANTGPGTFTQAVAGVWNSAAYCKLSVPWSAGTQVKMMLVYPLPWDLQFSAIYQNMPGAPILATYPAPAAEVMASLPGNRFLGVCAGRPTCVANTTVSLVAPGEAYEDRLQQVDLRFSRRFSFGTTNFSANADLANVTNRADVYSSNTGYGANWLVPYEVAGGRILRLSGQLEF
ncbi:MAG: TonB-dependent receptor [Acidobacteria bacterium]|nr:TonB-dependent receptor [Acidobacteriota bacterium]